MTRTIDGKTISSIGLGCVTFGREIDERASFTMLDHAYSKGITFVDTAAAYSNGASETIVGKWLNRNEDKKHKVIVATKILPPFDEHTITRSVDESLKRLQLETIDLLYLHRWDVTVDNPGSLQALDNLITKKKISILGASNFTTEQLLNTLQMQIQNNLTTFRYVQNNHNLAVSDIGKDFQQVCAQHGINIVTYSPLGAGFLTGKHQHGVGAGTRFDLIPGHKDVYFNDVAFSRLAKLKEVAEKTGHSLSHLALAWAMHQKGVRSALIGGRTTAHIDQAIDALSFNDPHIFSELENT